MADRLSCSFIFRFHLKLPSLVRNGVVQRFCQQCGRFHDLTAFDSGMFFGQFPVGRCRIPTSLVPACELGSGQTRRQ